MNPDLAENNLQTIRTLMERSALYRRALAPIMLFAGVAGMVAAGSGLFFHIDRPRTFSVLWLGTAVVVMIGAFLIARRQAFEAQEVFWSPPTKRVAQALAPPFASGTMLGLLFSWVLERWDVFGILATLLPFFWAFFYGCALHSAGFFISRGVRWFGWIYIALAPSIVVVLLVMKPKYMNPHLVMGFFFGALHLAYGAYLSLTEKSRNEA